MPAEKPSTPPSPREYRAALRRGPWKLEAQLSKGHFSCAGCGPYRDSAGVPFMLVTGQHECFDLCLSCAAELRDIFLDATEQRA